MIYLPHLETNVTGACQNACSGCNHFVVVDKPWMLDPIQMQADLDIFKHLVHVGAYGMLGGEPTLHPQLAALIKIAKDSGIADKIEVWTNGQRLRTHPLVEMWLSPFDTLVVSRYPGKLTDLDVENIEKACRCYGKEFILKDESRHPNFTQLLKTVPGRAKETWDHCWFKTFSRVLDQGFFFTCCCGPYLSPLLLGRPFGTDGLAVDTDLTEEKILDYLERRQPLEACGPCAGRNTQDAVPITWREIRDPKAWVEGSAGR
jgi:cyclic pyranopterin phosphate synthase